MREDQSFSTYVSDETEEAFYKERAWIRRERLERLKVAVRGAGLDSEDAAELTAMIDREMVQTG